MNLLPIILRRRNATRIMPIMKSRMFAIINTIGEGNSLRSLANPRHWREARYRRRLQSGTQITLPDRLVQGVTSATYTKPVGICHRGTVKFNPFTSYARESHPRDFGSSSQDYKQPLLPIAATCASI